MLEMKIEVEILLISYLHQDSDDELEAMLESKLQQLKALALQRVISNSKGEC